MGPGGENTVVDLTKCLLNWTTKFHLCLDFNETCPYQACALGSLFSIFRLLRKDRSGLNLKVRNSECTNQGLLLGFISTRQNLAEVKNISQKYARCIQWAGYPGFVCYDLGELV